MSRAARETQAQQAAEAAPRGRAVPQFAPAPPLATPFTAGAAPLPEGLRGEMEDRFGQDFASVRVAGDAFAAQAARGFGARAFAQGEQISLAGGEFDRGLIAHELTHVLQQREAGRIEIACDGTGLAQTVSALCIELDQAADAAARQPLVARALELADQLAAALAVASAPKGDDEKAEEARALLNNLGSMLISTGEVAAAIALAGKTPDVIVQSHVVNGLGSPETVEGQQAVAAQIAPLAGQKVAAPGKPEHSRQWLAANAQGIGKTLATLDQRGLKGRRRDSLALEKTEQLMAGMMTTSDQDERPDPTGNPLKLGTDDTTKKIKADCDVYATVAARLLREQGWETVGYMVVVPHEKDPHDENLDRAAHAVSLARKPADATDPAKGYFYVGSSNTTLRELGGHEHALTDDTAAMSPLSDLMFDVYDAPKPRNFDVYYQPALKGGAYDMRLLDPENSGLKPLKTARSGTAATPATEDTP